VVSYPIVKTLHILSATVLFGTGLGIAFFFWMGGRAGDDRAALFAARATVTADLLFTTTAGIAQPLTGAWLVWRGGFDPADRWLVVTYLLYLLAGACWLPVVWIQLRVRDQLAVKVTGGPFDSTAHARLRRWWFALGWPAFLALVVVVHLMVTKPTW
jgi:uncharacterized membrane protein